MAAMLGIDRGSAFRLANTLKRRGFLANPSAGRDYVPGPSVWRLSRQYDWSKMLALAAHEALKTLAAETNETAHLAVERERELAAKVVAVAAQVAEMVGALED
jgi:IclR family acetate operon transcriptional repressor